MDWRLIAAVSAAAGSFCFVRVGAYVVVSHSPAPQQTFAPPRCFYRNIDSRSRPRRRCERAAHIAKSVRARSVRAKSSPFAPQGNSVPAAVTSGAAAAPRLGEDFNKSSQGRSEPKQEPRTVGYKTATLTPYDAAPGQSHHRGRWSSQEKLGGAGASYGTSDLPLPWRADIGGNCASKIQSEAYAGPGASLAVVEAALAEMAANRWR